jgi:hypothetical protein
MRVDEGRVMDGAGGSDEAFLAHLSADELRDWLEIERARGDAVAFALPDLALHLQACDRCYAQLVAARAEAREAIADPMPGFVVPGDRAEAERCLAAMAGPVDADGILIDLVELTRRLVSTAPAAQPRRVAESAGPTPRLAVFERDGDALVRRDDVRAELLDSSIRPGGRLALRVELEAPASPRGRGLTLALGETVLDQRTVERDDIAFEIPLSAAELPPEMREEWSTPTVAPAEVARYLHLVLEVAAP